MSKAKTPDECKAELHLYLQQYGDVATEHRFHPVRRWRFDYAIPGRLLAVEFQGMNYRSSHVGGHRSITGTQSGYDKHNAAMTLGWIILYATTTTIRDGSFYEVLDRVIQELEAA